MYTDSQSGTSEPFSVFSILTILVGLAVTGYGFLLVPTSALGGGHVALIGFFLLLAGLFAAEWVGDRLGLSADYRRKLSLLFAVLAAFLLIVFVVVNFASFESGGFERSG